MTSSAPHPAPRRSARAARPAGPGHILRLAALLLLWIAGLADPALAQVQPQSPDQGQTENPAVPAPDTLRLPGYQSTTLNDFASLLPPQTASRVETALRQLKAEWDVEMTVVTLERRAEYGPWATMERFATALFNDWGVGAADRNDGILFLILSQDREVRIELGRGYNRDFDWVAQKIIDEFVLPRFRAGDFATGIEAGTNAIIRKIALPLAEGRAPQTPGFVERARDHMVPIVFGLMMLSALFGRAVSDRLQRLRRCPSCGRRGTLRRRRKTLRPASRHQAGAAERRTTCSNCDYEDRSRYTLPRFSRSRGSGGFGGGSSRGGGASGRW